MSLKGKIALSFVISASIIAALVALEYVNYVEIRRQITFIELTDTIRSKTLQLRRYEKNFFLYRKTTGDDDARKTVHRYLGELGGILAANHPEAGGRDLSRLKALVDDYGRRFSKIESDVDSLDSEFEKTKTRPDYKKFYPLVELTFLERPKDAADYLTTAFGLPVGHPLTAGLYGLDGEIRELRRTGEEIINVSRELDKAARADVEGMTKKAQISTVVFFPLFLAVGLGLLFVIVSNVTNRLRVLMDAIESTGEGAEYHEVAGADSADEVGLLIGKFNRMEAALAKRDAELKKKNEELLHSKKLAAIGTLAAGVAHELNNPLNNIYISAQVLAKQASYCADPEVTEIVSDIVGQTARVKRITGDLLEYARGREPQKRPVELREMVIGVHRLLATTTLYGRDDIEFSFIGGEGLIIQADPDQLERVFINLFANAKDSMEGPGSLKVTIQDEGGTAVVAVTDTGKGITAENCEKLFEPFYTTKDKGTGLGLAIVFNIIKKHGGTIAVASEPGRGTTFTITLPKSEPSPPAPLP